AAGTRVYSGLDGTQLAAGGPGDSYFMPIVYDVNGDSINEVTLQGGFSPARTFNHNLSSAVWTSADDDRPYPYGAVAACPGAAVYGDADGDGRDEILVSVADGFLYDLKNAALPPPASVIDTDPDNGINNQDIDSIVTESKLSCVWTAVPGAASYEVAILVNG